MSAPSLTAASETIVHALARASLEGSALCVLIALAVFALPKLPAQARTWLWWSVSARLLLGLLSLPVWHLALTEPTPLMTTSIAAIAPVTADAQPRIIDATASMPMPAI